MFRSLTLSNDQVHYINIGLMLVSCVLAFVLPFELFLFSYAVLGPLHYLTEIGWLHKKNYFTRGKYDFLFLALLCFLVFFFTFIKPSPKQTQIPAVFTLAVVASLVFVFLKDNLYRLAVIALTVVGLAAAEIGSTWIIWAGVFLPTLIHVFIFTWAFMLYGVLKNRSFAGYLSVAVLGVIALLFFFVKAPGLQYKVTEFISSRYTIFSIVNTSMLQLFGMGEPGNSPFQQVYESNAGFIIMRFIAFSYTYHYLNWFSKTSVIRWHKVPRKALAITIFLWVVSVALYAYKYEVGVKALFLLSFLHVFLEFPLNVTSFHGIARSLLPAPRSAPPGPARSPQRKKAATVR